MIHSDRNLLYGILALQMDFVTRDALVAAMHAWVLDKAQPLGEFFLRQGALDTETHRLLDALVEKHLAAHGNDPGRSLAAVRLSGGVPVGLRAIDDDQLGQSLARLPASGADAGDPHQTVAPAPGLWTASLSRFRKVRPHARGGLGEVHLAHDEELHRPVALKEIQEQLADDPESRSRFLVEAEITGGLEHPGVVPVYGLGQYPDGRPYYAMRFIRGDSLQEAIRRFHRDGGDPGERALRFRQLLGRFLDACNALAYAHSRGVIHRDLKPSNVMLGPFGETLVVDWGLAKPLGRVEGGVDTPEPPLRPESSAPAAPTQFGSAVGTPQYMSPEQATGDPARLGPASDVYGLGATLYSLLTGKPPFDGADLGELLRRVQRGDFQRPREVNPTVPPALEAVCLKAMALRPEDRYRGPRELADDLEHWLADEPVTAYREPLPARLARWGRRHRTLAVGLFTLLFTAVLALSLSTYLIAQARHNEKTARVAAERAEGRALAAAGRATTAREAAEEAREKEKAAAKQARAAADQANKVSQFLVELFQGADPLGIGHIAAFVPKGMGEELTARKILDRGARRIAAGLKDEPATRARLMDTIGDVYRTLAVYDESRKLLEEGLKLRRKIDPNSLDTAASLHHLGWWHQDRGDYVEAERLYRDALALRGRKLADDHPLVAECQFHLAWVLALRGELSDAEGLLDKALAARLKHFGDGHREVGLVYFAKAFVVLRRNRLAEAALLSLKAMSMVERDKRSEGLAPALAQFQRGVFLQEAGWLGAADTQFLACLKTLRERVGEGHPYEALILFHRALLLEGQDDPAGAEALYRQALALAGRTVGPQHPLLLQAVIHLANLLARKDKVEEARGFFEKLLAAQRDHFPPGTPILANTLTCYGQFLFEQKRRDDAEPMLREAAEIYAKHDCRTFEALLNAQLLTFFARSAKRYDKARQYAELALSISRDLFGEDSFDYAAAECALANVLFDQKQFAEAKRHFLASLAAFGDPGALSRVQSGKAVHALHRLALTHAELREYEEAARRCLESIALNQRHFPEREKDPDRFRAAWEMGLRLASRKRPDLAARLWTKAAEISRDSVPEVRKRHAATLWYVALARMAGTEPGDYPAIIAEMVKASAGQNDVRHQTFVARLAILTAGDLAACAPFEERGKERIKAGKASSKMYRVVAALHYRRKEYRECLEKLAEAAKLPTTEGVVFDSAYGWLFETLARHRLGEEEAARAALRRAARWLDLLEENKWMAPTTKKKVKWDYWTELQLLHREAEGLLGNH